ncbi:isoprenylcysteine carboxylmethyltransferase family protein [Mycolicibacterium sp. CR10]|uniref:methyltransferase family protein n=1 Tax=Mycolicibacterium sp. CR10 TaxID=2562314 RepID=UPI001F108CC5|nr:isoprenylcysteine carboxylmethyltransferase family protein [Mycolicibacterium sp. CR10]
MMFPVIALLLVATFWLLDGLVRSRVQRHRTGDSGIRIPRTAQQWSARLTLAAGMLLPGIAAPIAELLGMPPIPLLDHWPLRVTGLALATIGVLASFGAQHAMGPSWRTTVDPTEQPALITSGIFAIVRNPIYAAINVMVIGLTLLVPNGIALAGVVFVITGSQLQVRLIEEPYLREIHGPGFHDYASRVGRFLPGIGRLRVQPQDHHR